MKVTKAYLGKHVEVVWLDPLGALREPVDKAPKGRAALGEWTEYGVIDDLTDGVVRVIHSRVRNPGSPEYDEISYTVVPEELVTKITILERVENGPLPPT